MTIVVCGSINMDLVAQTPRLPAPGETIVGRQFITAPGGKGANQAVAAARLQAPTKLVGRVGDDLFGQELRHHLSQAGVDTTTVLTTKGVASGVAVIVVNEAGQNNIIIIPGANHRLLQTDLDHLKPLLTNARVLLLQLEIPLETTLAAARLARQHNVTVILDPAPARELPAELYQLVNFITPNEVEASQLVGFPVKNKADAARAGQVLLQRGVKTAIIKLGALGVFYTSQVERSANDGMLVPAFKVKTVDTVAAGDAFNGALAVALTEGQPISGATRFAVAVAALSTMQAGAQTAMPSRVEVAKFLQTQG